MAKIYYATAQNTVTKSLIGPWVIRDHRTGRDMHVPPHISAKFGKVVGAMRKEGFDTNRDKYAIGAVFSWMITVTTTDPLGPDWEMASQLFSAPMPELIKVLTEIYDQLSLTTM